MTCPQRRLRCEPVAGGAARLVAGAADEDASVGPITEGTKPVAGAADRAANAVGPVAGGERGAAEAAGSVADDEAEEHVDDDTDEGLVARGTAKPVAGAADKDASAVGPVAKGASADNAAKDSQRGQTIPVQGWIAGDTPLIISAKAYGTWASSFRFIRQMCA